MKTFRTAIFGITIGLAAMTAGPALAQNPDIVVGAPFVELPDGRMISSQAVSYADLNLALSEDRMELRRRISSTARDVCSQLRRHSDYINLTSDCENGAIGGAFDQVRAAEGDWALRP